MKRSNKKGFTLVELVIVVAVIAILAGVLIPTIAGVVRKANTAADTAVAKEMNNVLAEYSADATPANFDEVLAVLKAAGYDILALNAKADGNYYAWDKANNQIVYIGKDGETIYKNKNFNEADLVKVASGASSLKDTIAAGGNVQLAADVTVTGDKAGDKNIVDTDGAKVDFSNKNIVLAMDGKGANWMGLSVDGAKDVVITGAEGGITVTEENKNNAELCGIVVENANGADPIAVTISGGKYIVGSQAVYLRGFNITCNITGGFFQSNIYDPMMANKQAVLNAKNNQGNKFVITGGTFVNFDLTDIPALSAALGGDAIEIPDTHEVKAETQANGDVWYTVVAK